MPQQSTKKVIPKKRGRPATGKDPMMALRMSPHLKKRIGDWAAKNGEPSRSEAIRLLVEIALDVSASGRKIPLIVASGDARAPSRAKSQKGAERAAHLAAEQVDKMSDQALPPEERQMRKRRLIKGPKEFRDIRSDQPSAKKR
jgi:hypothetical protein